MQDVNEIPTQLNVTGHTVMDKTLTAHARHEIPAKNFAVPSREGLPIENEGHVRAAMARFNQEHFTSPSEKRAAFHRIVARAHELGIDPSGFKKEHGDDQGYDMPNADDAGQSQSPLETGIKAPDIAANIESALAGMKEKYDALKAQYDELDKAHGISLASQLQAEKERDQGSERAGLFEREAAAHRSRADKAEAERDEMKRKLDAARALFSDEKKRADTAEASATQARLDAADVENKRVEERALVRADLLTKAIAVAGVADRSSMSDEGVMRDALKTASGAEIPADKSITYIQARFDALVEGEMTAAASRANARQALNQARNDAQDPAKNPVGGVAAERDAHASMTDRAAKAWIRH